MGFFLLLHDGACVVVSVDDFIGECFAGNTLRLRAAAASAKGKALLTLEGYFYGNLIGGTYGGSSLQGWDECFQGRP